MKRVSAFVIGLLVGAMLFGGGAVYAASGVLAERSNNRVYVDGKEVQLEAYLIDGNNYVKLRDVGQAVGFNVWWDGTVQVDSGSAYTGIAPGEMASDAGPVDYSLTANPDVFVGVYTREAYNAAYEVLAGLKEGDGSRTGIVHIDNQEDRWKLTNMLLNLWNGNVINLKGIAYGSFEVYNHEVDLAEMNAVMQEKLQQWAILPSDSEKVAAANEYLCGQLTYQAGETESILEVVSAKDPIPANCVTYAFAMNYLCGQLGIPCITVPGENHIWNAMYCNGTWSYTDVSANDLSQNHNRFLLSNQPPKELLDPAGIQFLKELLVPASTI